MLKILAALIQPLVDFGCRHSLKDTGVGFQDALAQLVVVIYHIFTGVLQLARHPGRRVEHLKCVRHVGFESVADLKRDVSKDRQNLRLHVPVHLAVDQVPPQDGHDLLAVWDELFADRARDVAHQPHRSNADLPVFEVLKSALQDGVKRLHIVVEVLSAGDGEGADGEERLVKDDTPVVEDGDEGAHQLVRALQYGHARSSVLGGVLHRQLLDDNLEHSAEVPLQLAQLLRLVHSVGGHDDGLQLLDDHLHKVAENEDGVAARVAHHIVDCLKCSHGEVGAVVDRSIRGRK
mmetsp:Transcript_30861/g.55226  ORF Transcript_30861/g.55226 Transcript_30861/m.55226 type:complete len:291 (-) Transcript_30861:940-1812(-)